MNLFIAVFKIVRKSEFFQTFQSTSASNDYFDYRMINNLPTECPNIKSGCSSKLTRGIVKDHVLFSCEFVEVPCE
jgi:hypothetical protein